MERKVTVFSNRKDRVPTGEICAAMAARGTPVEWVSMISDQSPEEAAAWTFGAFYPEGEKRDTTKIDVTFQTADDYFVVDDFRQEMLAALKKPEHEAAARGVQTVYSVSVRASLLAPGKSFDAAFDRTVRNLVVLLAEAGQGLIEDEDGAHHLPADYASQGRLA